MSGLKLACVFVIAGVLAVACDDGSSGGGSGGGSSASFDVALADSVGGGSGALVSSNATEGEVNALARHVLEAKQAEGKAIEVWINAPDYFYPSGKVRAREGEWANNWYTVVWDAYDPSDPTKSKLGDGDDQVMIGKSKTDGDADNGLRSTKLGRATVRVGSELLNARGAVVVVSIYQPATKHTGLDVNWDRVARFELKITKAPEINLTGLAVSARGAAGADDAAATAALVPAVVSAKAGFTVELFDTNSATVTLELADAVKAGPGKTAVVFNTFQIVGTPSWLVGGWAIAKGTDVGTTTTVSATKLASAKASFTADAATDRGQVLLTGKDKYGQEATITVTLDPKYS